MGGGDSSASSISQGLGLLILTRPAVQVSSISPRRLGKCIDSPCPDHSAFGLEYPAPCRGQGAFGMTLLVSVATPAKPPPTMNRELLLGFQFMMLNKPARTEGDRPRQTDAHSPCGRLRA